MILAEKITTLRKRNGWSQEDLAERVGVSRQAISKWEGALSTPDLNRILDLAKVFGVTTDLLLRDEEDLGALPEIIPDPEKGREEILPFDKRELSQEPLRIVSMEEANDYLKQKAVSAGRIAIGVMLCILSPITLILLAAAQEEHILTLSEEQAAGIGILVLMLLVGTAVGIFVYYGMKLSRFDYIGKEALETAYGVDGMIRERMERYSGDHLRYMVIGILLCVLSCLPMFVGLIIDKNDDFIMISAICVMLALIAIGVLLIVRTNIIMGAMKSLLEEGEFSRENKRENKRNETVMGIYWLSATALYLLISFLTQRWDMTWIVWPVAGVGCGILAGVLKVLRTRE